MPKKESEVYDCSNIAETANILLPEKWVPILIESTIEQGYIKDILDCIVHYYGSHLLTKSDLAANLSEAIPKLLAKFALEVEHSIYGHFTESFTSFLQLQTIVNTKDRKLAEIIPIILEIAKVKPENRETHLIENTLITSFSRLLKEEIASKHIMPYTIEKELCCNAETSQQLFYLLGLFNSKLEDKVFETPLQKEIQASVFSLLNQTIPQEAPKLFNQLVAADHREHNETYTHKLIAACLDAKLDPAICQSVKNGTYNITTTFSSNTPLFNASSSLTTSTISTDLPSLLFNTNATVIEKDVIPPTTIPAFPYFELNTTILENFTNNITKIFSLENTPAFVPNTLSFISKMVAPFVAGVIAGCLEVPSAILLHIAKRKGCLDSTLNRIKFVLTFTSAFAIAMLPLLYSLLLDDLDSETNDPLTLSQKIISTTTIFLLNMLLQGIAYYSETKLSRNSLSKLAVKFLPLLAVIGMVVNVEEGLEKTLENIQEGLLLFGFSLLGAAIPKTLVNTFTFFCSHAHAEKITQNSIELNAFDAQLDPLLSKRSSNSSNSSSESLSLDLKRFSEFLKKKDIDALEQKWEPLKNVYTQLKSNKSQELGFIKAKLALIPLQLNVGNSSQSPSTNCLSSLKSVQISLMEIVKEANKLPIKKGDPTLKNLIDKIVALQTVISQAEKQLHEQELNKVKNESLNAGQKLGQKETVRYLAKHGRLLYHASNEVPRHPSGSYDMPKKITCTHSNCHCNGQIKPETGNGKAFKI